MRGIVLAALVLIGALSAPAHAATLVFDGTIDGPTKFARPLENGNNVPTAARPDASFFYQANPFTVTTAGIHKLTLTSPQFDTYLVLYANAFDPDAPLVNVLLANDDAGDFLGSFLSTNLALGSYVAVATTFSPEFSGPYTLTIEGPDVGSLVPEPETWALLIVGLGLVGGALRARKTKLRSALV